MAARTREFGWHVQLQLDGRELPEREALIRKVTSTLVIDHVGKFSSPFQRIIQAFACWFSWSKTGALM
jgi:D-galactarolactone isomerase